ncbi:MAG: hypothetical protein SFU21_04590 [Flavihumibacter sp.]|nr:hypothetical protein [Flavihumibacter sp.]
MKKDPVWSLVLYYVLAVLFILALAIVFSSCTATKSKALRKTDSTAVSKLDSGAVKKATTESNSQWQREVFLYDTGKEVNNYITQPIMYIRESGQQQQKTNNIDSGWKKAIDSVAAKIEQSNKSKETTVLNPWQIIAICIGGSLLLYVFLNYFSKFKIVRT